MIKYLVIIVLSLSFSCSILSSENVIKYTEKGSNMTYWGKSNIETRKRILVLDAGLPLKDLDKKYMCRDIALANLRGIPETVNDHGINIVSIISKGMDTSKYCITMLTVFPDGDLNKAIRDIKYFSHNLYAVNISMTGGYYNQETVKVIRKLTNNGIHISVAAGNDDWDLSKVCNIYPVCYRKVIKSKNFKVIGIPYHVIGIPQSFSNSGAIVDVFIEGYNMGTPPFSGSSQSTASFTRSLLK